MEIGESVHRAGLRKLVFVNSHGGNSDLIGVIARELRVRFGMLAVYTNWMRFGYPAGLFAEDEIAFGIHAGDIETSLMLHFRPELVRREAIANFTPASAGIAKDFALLQMAPPHALAWAAQDLHPDGACGNATLATPEKGEATARHQAQGFVTLLLDVAAYPLDNLVS